MQTKAHKLKHIEGIRGLAAMIVVLHHFTLAFYSTLNTGDISQANIGDGSLELFLYKTPFNLMYNGGFAVSVFFILSGYVLSQAYHRSNDHRVLIQYSLKRYFRLFVPVSVTIIIAFVLIRSDLFFNHAVGDITKSRSWLNDAFNYDGGITSVLKNMFVEVFFFKDNRYNPVLWTMTYELLGSFLLFAFLLICHKLSYKSLCFVLVSLVLIFTDNCFYAAFILGAFLNRLAIKNALFEHRLFRNKCFMISVLVIAVYFNSFPLNNVDASIYEPLVFPYLNNYEFYHVTGAFLFMIVLLGSSQIKSFLSGSLFVYLGKISFSFYLLHFIIMCSLSCFLFLMFHTQISYHSAVFYSFIISLSVIFICSHYYHKWIDQSGIILSEKFLKWAKLKL